MLADSHVINICLDYSGVLLTDEHYMRDFHRINIERSRGLIVDKTGLPADCHVINIPLDWPRCSLNGEEHTFRSSPTR